MASRVCVRDVSSSTLHPGPLSGTHATPRLIAAT
jgi:hypothetical protein